MRYDLIIRGGTVISASDTCIADLAISKGRVKAVGSIDAPSSTEVDARGKVVFPGAVTAMDCVAIKSSTGKLRKRIPAECPAVWGGITTILWNSLPESCSIDYSLLLRSDRRRLPTSDLLPAQQSTRRLEAGAITSVFFLWDAVQKGLMSENRFVDVIATTPAKSFGLYPRKGNLSPGADADIVILDPNKPHIIRPKVPLRATGQKIIKGSLIAVYSRGKAIISNGEWIDAPQHGYFIKRASGLLQ